MKIFLKLILPIALLFFCSEHVFSKNGSFSIRGKIDTSLTNSFNSFEMCVRINKSAADIDESQLIRIPLKKDGSFSYTFQTYEKRSYLSFWIMNNDTTGSSQMQNRLISATYLARSKSTPLQELYLFEQGDSVDMQIMKSGHIYFKGRGSKKLNCQLQIYSIEDMPTIISLRASQLAGDSLLQMESGVLQMSRGIKLKLLESYRSELTADVYNLLYADILAMSEYHLQYNLPIINADVPQKEKKIISFFQTQISSKEFKIDSTLIVQSGYYADMLFEREFNFSRLYTKTGNYAKGDSFRDIYERIKNKYSGKLRDKLLFICFQKMKQYYPSEQRFYVQDALAIMQDGIYKYALNQLQKKMFKAYPFKFEDIHGKTHNLSDYKGKVLVIDFWFTGCGACTYINAAMHPIIDKYKNVKDVVFLTVSLDKKRSLWQKSISSGLYTSPTTINLYTNGMADQDPGFRYYNYIGAPQQLIIGKEGGIVSSQPPRPGADSQERIDMSIFRSDEVSGRIVADKSGILSNINSIKFMQLIDKELSSNP